jgi:mannitol/fructose-specific phosphotransferase system IIA component (Ntr-type)
MRFSKLVKKKNIFAELECDEREGALREMIGKLAKNGEVGEDGAEKILEGLMSRERLGTTGIGKGIAIPHVRSDDFDDVLIAVGRSSGGVDFAAVDGDLVKLVFLILAPESKQDDYMAALRWVSTVGRDEYNNKLLLGATTAAGFVELFADIEEAS